MHIKLINKILYFDKYKIKCAIGKRGISAKKREGDGKTPKGLPITFYKIKVAGPNGKPVDIMPINLTIK